MKTVDHSQSCKTCGNDAWRVGKYRNAGGTEMLPLFCSACGNRTALFVKRQVADALLDYPLADLGEAVDMKTCEVCGGKGAEYHHWLPTALSEAADKWPGSYLCRPCHLYWHHTVTPGLVGGK